MDRNLLQMTATASAGNANNSTRPTTVHAKQQYTPFISVVKATNLGEIEPSFLPSPRIIRPHIYQAFSNRFASSF